MATRATLADSVVASAALEDLFSETMVFLHGAARRQGLTLLQLVALRVVARTGALSPSALADKFGVSRPAVTSSINILEAGGWVVRSHPGGDRRRLRTTLTPRAQRALRSVASERRRFLEVGLSTLGPAERAEFVRSLGLVTGQLRECPIRVDPQMGAAK